MTLSSHAKCDQFIHVKNRNSQLYYNKLNLLRTQINIKERKKNSFLILTTSTQWKDFASNLLRASWGHLTVVFLCRKLSGGGVVTWMEQGGEESQDSSSITIIELPW